MFFSKSFIPILKNNPAEAKIKSHQLMLRTGMIKQSSAGIYSWLPLGFKIMKKIEQIVRKEIRKQKLEAEIKKQIKNFYHYPNKNKTPTPPVQLSSYLFNTRMTLGKGPNFSVMSNEVKPISFSMYGSASASKSNLTISTSPRHL